MGRITYRTLKAGDLFFIPLTDEVSGVGNVLIPGSEMYICVYREVFARDAADAVPDVGSLTPFLIGRTSDELFHHGRWTPFRRGAMAPEFPRPCYVVHSTNGLVLKSFDSQTLRGASDEDMSFYGRQVSFSNITFAKALSAFHGYGELTPGYDYSRLSYERACERSLVREPSSQ